MEEPSIAWNDKRASQRVLHRSRERAALKFVLLPTIIRGKPKVVVGDDSEKSESLMQALLFYADHG